MNHLATILGVILGLLVGLLAAVTDINILDRFVEGVSPLGTLFINALQMVVIPLVLLTVFAGVARLGSPKKIGKLGGYTLGFFWVTTIPAITIGIVFMKAVLEMEIWPIPVESITPVDVPPEIPGSLDFFLSLIPTNPFNSASEGELLPLIVFTLLVATAAGALPHSSRQRLVDLAEDAAMMFLKLTDWILLTAPVGVFGIMAPVMAGMGLGLLASLSLFVATVFVGLLVFISLFYLPLVKFVGKKNLGQFIKGVIGTCSLGFSTCSSVACLPVMFEEAEDLGVSPSVASLALPLGASINRAGSALFQGSALVLLAALSGISLSVTTLVSAGIAGILVAMTVAPVPSASVITLIPLLEIAGVPLTGLGILLGIDRIPDMFRTTSNVMGHVACCVVVDEIVGDEATASDLAGATGPE